MVEFTGERLVPGQVDTDLFNEHFSRYQFCAGFVQGRQCLDAGCGLGYGSAALAEAAATVVGVDNDPATIAEATVLYGKDNLSFAVADVQDLPYEEASFDCAVSFEVIEHLSEPAALVDALRHVTRPSGLVILSTPNREAYNVSRGDAGPNPFHQHEFSLQEFEELLRSRFAYVSLFAQNHTPAITFRKDKADGPLTVFSSVQNDVDTLLSAQFFIAVCSQSPLPPIADALYVAHDGNVLLERDAHIRLLQDEMALKTSWLDESKKALDTLHTAHEALKKEHDQRSAWAMETISNLEAINKQLADQLQAKCDELETAVNQLNAAEETIVARSAWAKGLDAELEQLRPLYKQLLDERDQLATTLAERHQECANLRATVDGLQGPHRELLLRFGQLRTDFTAQMNALAYHAGLISTKPEAPKQGGLLSTEEEFQQAQALFTELEHAVAKHRHDSERLELAFRSRWNKLGGMLGLGPNADRHQKESQG